MHRLRMSEEILNDIYHVKRFDTESVEGALNFGKIGDRDRLLAAKQILLGIAILYVITLLAYLVNPDRSEKLVDICMTIFPPLATLIIAFYFKDKI